MSTIKVSNLQNASAASAAIVLASDSTATLNGLAYPTSGSLSGRNRIINGDMRIDQRNAGASVTPSTDGSYQLDRWQSTFIAASKFSVQQSSTAPTGFKNSTLITSVSAYSVTGSDRFGWQQSIEGFNIADLDWGTANAKTVTLSFWVRSSLTGTHGGALANNGNARSYPFSFTVNAADTWEYKTITIAGDTTGTWLSTNGTGIVVRYCLGAVASYRNTAGSWVAGDYWGPTGGVNLVGTNGATFYITGVQLEAGSVATPFERRSYGQELALCQRYYYKMQSSGGNSYFGTGYNYSTTGTAGLILFPVTMRTAPSALEQSGTAGDYRIAHGTSSTTCSSVPIWDSGDVYSARVAFTVASGLTTGQGSMLRSVNSTAYLAWSAEL